MFAPMTSHKTKKASACRRLGERQKLNPTHITCWSAVDPVKTVAAIEADTFGARLMIPWNARKNESIMVSVADEVGQYQTQIARIAWTQKMQFSDRVIAGVEFTEELQVAV